MYYVIHKFSEFQRKSFQLQMKELVICTSNVIQWTLILMIFLISKYLLFNLRFDLKLLRDFKKAVNTNHHIPRDSQFSHPKDSFTNIGRSIYFLSFSQKNVGKKFAPIFYECIKSNYNVSNHMIYKSLQRSPNNIQAGACMGISPALSLLARTTGCWVTEKLPTKCHELSERYKSCFKSWIIFFYLRL